MMTDRNIRNAWLTADDRELSAACELDFHKASGHGGQHVNKTSSAVRLTHGPSGFSVSCSEERSQHENRRIALKMLRLKIAREIRCEADPGFRIPEVPPSLSNPLYPVFEAALLDVFESVGADLKAASLQLGAGTTRIVKLFFRDPALWQIVRKMRTDRGLPPLNPPKGTL